MQVTETNVKKVMKQQMDMSYRTVKIIPKQGNTERCLVLRQQYALKMLSLLEQSKTIINVDESWLNETTFIRKVWFPK